MTENYNLDSENPKDSEALESNSEEINNTQVDSIDNFNEKSNGNNDLKNKSENNDKQTKEDEDQADSQTKSQIDFNGNFNEQSNGNNDLKNKSENNDKQTNKEEYQADSETKSRVDSNDNLNEQSNDDDDELENQIEDDNQQIIFVESEGVIKSRKEKVENELKCKNNEYNQLVNKIDEQITNIYDAVDAETKNTYERRKKNH